MSEQAITIHVPPEFAVLCHGHLPQLTPEQVLTAFMHDLAETNQSNGSDERMLADSWFRRVVWPEPPERTFTIEMRDDELGGGWKLRLFSDGVECGGGVFPIDPSEDRVEGSARARLDAEDEGNAWIDAGPGCG